MTSARATTRVPTALIAPDLRNPNIQATVAHVRLSQTLLAQCTVLHDVVWSLAHRREAISVTALARHAGYSVGHLNRLFKQHLGMTARELRDLLRAPALTSAGASNGRGGSACDTGWAPRR